jgi:hypothetical protein
VRTYLEKTHHTHKKRAGGVAQGIGPEFKSQYHKRKAPNGIYLKTGLRLGELQVRKAVSVTDPAEVKIPAGAGGQGSREAHEGLGVSFLPKSD